MPNIGEKWLNEKWVIMEKNKLEWAYKAHNEFIEKISHEPTKKYLQDDKKKKIAILYGKSQVGKTTLILTLMGVKDDMYVDLEDVLRAGRPQGSSSTSTAIRYGYSKNNNWFCCNQEIADKAEVKNRLKKVREEIIANQLNAFEIRLDIPFDYFEKTYNIDIVDLPGIESRDMSEKRYVLKLTGKYLLESNLTIVVATATDVQNIKKFKLDDRFEWYNLPSYRVVTTRTYESESIRKEIGGINSKEELNKLYMEDTKECLKGIKTYPLDFGKSFLDLREKDRRKYEKIKPIRDALLQDLRDDILTSRSEYEKIIRSFTIFNVIVKELESKKSQRKKIEDEINKIEEEYGNEKRKIEQKIENISKSDDFEMGKLIGRLKLSEKVVSFNDELSNDNLELYFDEQEKNLKKACMEYISENLTNLRLEYIVIIEQDWHKYTKQAKEDVNRYLLSRFIGNGDGDGNTAFGAIREFADNTQKKINDEVDKKNKKIIEINNNKKKELEYNIRRENERLKEMLDKHDGNKKELEKNILTLNGTIKELENDKALEFGAFLDKAFKAEYNKTVIEINKNPNDDIQNLLCVAYLNTIDDEYKKIKKGQSV